MHVSGPLQVNGSSDGMVIDFSDLKEILCGLDEKFDHGLILEISDPLKPVIDMMDERCKHQCGFGKVVYLATAPTAENLAAYCFGYLKSALDRVYHSEDLKLEKVIFYETPTSRAIVEV